MAGLRPKQLARIGVSYLEEAVLDVLYEAVHGEDDQEMWLATTKTSKRLGALHPIEGLATHSCAASWISCAVKPVFSVLL